MKNLLIIFKKLLNNCIKNIFFINHINNTESLTKYDKNKWDSFLNSSASEYSSTDSLNGNNNIFEKYCYNNKCTSIHDFLEKNVKINYGYRCNYLDKYYTLIYSLLSLNNEYIIVTKNNFNEKNNIRELLYVHKDYEKLLNSNIVSDNKNNIYNDKKDHSNDNKNGASNDYSNFFYFSMKSSSKTDVKSNYEYICNETLHNNKDFVFNDCKLKEKYDKIIKIGIGICEKKKCNYDQDDLEKA
ncbi:hypothetical protein PIROE2DRAFT_9688 [Piromyces sp. E2]|nr:hypothetical protein PIROE2DRAFT_9688 [Piromyces sp. E2]|eukprot:OUM63748.1 hypothetical protein PIROE2DRAFT_9688 [Piromyces sp. E2]